MINLNILHSKGLLSYMGTAYKGNRLYITVKTKILILMAIELDVFWNVLWFIEAQNPGQPGFYH